jgi:hypothetical protein
MKNILINIWGYCVNIVKNQVWITIIVYLLIIVWVILGFIIFISSCTPDELLVYIKGARRYETYIFTSRHGGRELGTKISNFFYAIISFFFPSYSLSLDYFLKAQAFFLSYYNIYFIIFVLLFFLIGFYFALRFYISWVDCPYLSLHWEIWSFTVFFIYIFILCLHLGMSTLTLPNFYWGVAFINLLGNGKFFGCLGWRMSVKITLFMKFFTGFLIILWMVFVILLFLEWRAGRKFNLKEEQKYKKK